MKWALCSLALALLAASSGCWRPYYGQTYAAPVMPTYQPQVVTTPPPAPVYQAPAMAQPVCPPGYVPATVQAPVAQPQAVCPPGYVPANVCPPGTYPSSY